MRDSSPARISPKVALSAHIVIIISDSMTCGCHILVYTVFYKGISRWSSLLMSNACFWLSSLAGFGLQSYVTCIIRYKPSQELIPNHSWSILRQLTMALGCYSVYESVQRAAFFGLTILAWVPARLQSFCSTIFEGQHLD